MEWKMKSYKMWRGALVTCLLVGGLSVDGHKFVVLAQF